MTTPISRIAAIAALFVAQATFATAAELKVYATVGVKHSLEELAAKFEKANGHKLVLTFGTAAALAKRIQAGEQADLYVLTKQALETVAKDDKVVAGSERHFTSSVMAVAVKKGAAKPDLSTSDAFKAAMLAAKTIAYPDPAGGGFSGVYFVKVAEQLGIGDQVKAKAKYPPDALAAKLLVTGEAELAINQKPELLSVDGIEVAGPFPGALAATTIFSAGVSKDSKQGDVATAVIKFLETPEAAEIFKRDGFDPVPPAAKAS